MNGLNSAISDFVKMVPPARMSSRTILALALMDLLVSIISRVSYSGGFIPP
jgi:hypothetical protein